MKLRLTRPNQLVIAIFLFFAMAGSAMAANQIGTIAALVGKVSIEREGKVLKVEAGAPVFENDKIITAGKSRAQVLLLDQTAVNVGQKAELVLDQFVFGGEDDKVALKVTKGTFRFISGKVATKRPDKVNVETPVAVIGVRGTEFVGSVGEDATVALLDGRIEVANDVSSQTIALPGFGVTVDATSGSISAPVKIPQAELEAFLNATSTDRDTLDGEEADPETEGEGSDEEGDGGADDEGGQGPEEEGDTGSDDEGEQGPDDEGGQGPDDEGGQGPDDEGGQGPDDEGGQGPDDEGGQGPDDEGGQGPDDQGGQGPEDEGGTGPDDEGPPPGDEGPPPGDEGPPTGDEGPPPGDEGPPPGDEGPPPGDEGPPPGGEGPAPGDDGPPPGGEGPPPGGEPVAPDGDSQPPVGESFDTAPQDDFGGPPPDDPFGPAPQDDFGGPPPDDPFGPAPQDDFGGPLPDDPFNSAGDDGFTGAPLPDDGFAAPEGDFDAAPAGDLFYAGDPNLAPDDAFVFTEGFFEAGDDPFYGDAGFVDGGFDDPSFNDPNLALADPSFQDPALNDPNFDDPALNDPNFEDSAFNDPNFEDPAFDDPNFEDPAFNDPNFEDPAFNDPNFEDPAFNDPNFTSFDDPNFEDPAFNDPNFTSFDDPSFSDPSFADYEYQDPYAGDLFTDPYAGDSLFGDPIAGDAFIDPNFSDPNFSDPNFSDPNFSDPSFEDPAFSDPNFTSLEDPTFSDTSFTSFDDPSFSDPLLFETTFIDTNEFIDPNLTTDIIQEETTDTFIDEQTAINEEPALVFGLDAGGAVTGGDIEGVIVEDVNNDGINDVRVLVNENDGGSGTVATSGGSGNIFFDIVGVSEGGGEDGVLFDINPTSGEITFVGEGSVETSFNFEDPLDGTVASGTRDNIYALTLSITDLDDGTTNFEVDLFVEIQNLALVDPTIFNDFVEPASTDEFSIDPDGSAAFPSPFDINDFTAFSSLDEMNQALTDGILTWDRTFSTPFASIGCGQTGGVSCLTLDAFKMVYKTLSKHMSVAGSGDFFNMPILGSLSDGEYSFNSAELDVKGIIDPVGVLSAQGFLAGTTIQKKDFDEFTFEEVLVPVSTSDLVIEVEGRIGTFSDTGDLIAVGSVTATGTNSVGELIETTTQAVNVELGQPVVSGDAPAGDP